MVDTGRNPDRPPQMPNCSPASAAYRAHSICTGQDRQISPAAWARLDAPGPGNHMSGSGWSRQAARACQSRFTAHRAGRWDSDRGLRSCDIRNCRRSPATPCESGHSLSAGDGFEANIIGPFRRVGVDDLPAPGRGRSSNQPPGWLTCAHWSPSFVWHRCSASVRRSAMRTVFRPCRCA